MKLLKYNDIRLLIKKVGIENFIQGVHDTLREDFYRWQDFNMSPRHAFHYPDGVIELMPTTTNKLYSFKYVNGHPVNTKQNKLSIIAMGLLADVDSGFPLLLCDMTLLTAIRTAATSALAMGHLARKNSDVMALIGTGAQSEFQSLAAHQIIGVNKIQYFDIDTKAMEKFSANLQPYNIELFPCNSVQDVLLNADIITTATAKKLKVNLLTSQDLKPGMFINSIGGDCPGKTELHPDIIREHLTVVDFLDQAKIEGEIQNLTDTNNIIELRELVQGTKTGRVSDEQITVFDSVGCAIEDFSVLRYTYRLACDLQIGDCENFLPSPKDPKNLFELIS